MVAQIDARFIRTRPWKIWSRLLAYALFEGRPLTTRGRWINPLVFAGYRFWSILPLRERDLKPVFILGVGRSGTTVLGTILAMHRDVGYLNEPKALWHAALGDDDLIGSYSQIPGRYRMSSDDVETVQSTRLKRSYRAFLGLSFSRRVVDKYPELLFRNDLIDQVFPNSRKLVLLRNGADICQSIERWSKRHGHEQTGNTSDWWGLNQRKWHVLVDELVAPDPFFAKALATINLLDRHIDMAAVEWVVTMREVLRLKALNSCGMHFVRYEDLLTDNQRVLSEILEFCGLTNDPVMLGYGDKILARAHSYAHPQLHAEIQPLFDQTMTELGYRVP